MRDVAGFEAGETGGIKDKDGGQEGERDVGMAVKVMDLEWILHGREIVKGQRVLFTLDILAIVDA